MTFDQIAIVLLLSGMFVAFALDRFPVEHVAVVGLVIALALGLVPFHGAFSGFSNPAVITVVEVLLFVSVLARSHAIERLAEWTVARFRSERGVLAAVCGMGAFVSIFMNNIGALALLFPVALSVCARMQIPIARMLMPLSFATLLGGMGSLTGTPANLIVNDWMIRETGGGMGYFTIGYVGIPVMIVGVAWLVLIGPHSFRRLRRVPSAVSSPPARFLFEMRVRPGALEGLSLPEVERRHDLVIYDVMRDGAHVFARREAITIQAGDMLLAESVMEAAEALQQRGLIAAGLGSDRSDDGDRMEAVVMPDSMLVGSRLGSLDLLMEHGVSVVGLASHRHRVEGSFADLQIGLGDVIVLSGERVMLEEAAADAGLLPLSARPAKRMEPDAYRSAIIFAIGVAMTALGLLPPEIAFGAVVVAMALTGSLRLRHAMQDVNWTIVILLACMLPLGQAVQDTGTAHVIANALVGAIPMGGPLTVTTAMLLMAAALTTFVDNVSTAAVLSPVAAGLASRSGLPVEPLLIAVGIGTSLDFLTPFGHHNNTVVMGAAGYRFRDFPKLGLPLICLCLVTALLVERVVFF